MFLDYNTQKPSPPPLLARISGNRSRRTSGGPRLGTTGLKDLLIKSLLETNGAFLIHSASGISCKAESSGSFRQQVLDISRTVVENQGMTWINGWLLSHSTGYIASSQCHFSKVKQEGSLTWENHHTSGIRGKLLRRCSWKSCPYCYLYTFGEILNIKYNIYFLDYSDGSCRRQDAKQSSP